MGRWKMDCDVFITVVKKWVASAGADVYPRNMQTIVHRWKCIANGGDYVVKIVWVD